METSENIMIPCEFCYNEISANEYHTHLLECFARHNLRIIPINFYDNNENDNNEIIESPINSLSNVFNTFSFNTSNLIDDNIFNVLNRPFNNSNLQNNLSNIFNQFIINPNIVPNSNNNNTLNENINNILNQFILPYNSNIYNFRSINHNNINNNYGLWIGIDIDDNYDEYDFNINLANFLGKVEIGLTIDQINEVSTLEEKTDDNLNKCPICLEELKDCDNPRRLKCTHVFCNICILKWLEKHKKCPYCQIDLEDKFLFKI